MNKMQCYTCLLVVIFISASAFWLKSWSESETAITETCSITTTNNFFISCFRNKSPWLITSHKPIRPSALLYVSLLLYAAGDVELNPGPTDFHGSGYENLSNYPCGICTENCTWSDKAILCENCIFLVSYKMHLYG